MTGTEGRATDARPSPLEGERVRLRAIEETDLAWINEHFWNPEVTRFLVVVWPEPVSGTRAFWERVRASDQSTVVLIETREGEPVGVCGLESIQGRARTAELGIWIAEEHWDRGYGTDATRALCRFGFREMNLARVSLHVYDINPRGVRAYEKVGFREEGRLRDDQFVDGEHRDVIVMGLLADELREP
jgi:[ribosomal protein S5]-alanine N-acetyltransferase